MKKAVALLLAGILILSLMACSGGKTAKTNQAPALSASATPSPSAETSKKSTIGYITDEVDHFNRKPYKFASMALNNTTSYTQMLNDSLTNWGKVLNYELTVYGANMDYDGYINTIEIYANQGYDGIIAGVDDSLKARVFELCQDLNINFVGGPSAFDDDQKHIIWPSVNQDEYGNGALCVQWLADNYKTYWKDPIDEKALGLIVLDFSVVSGIHARVPGVHDTFVKLFPAAAANYYVGDLITIDNGFTQAGGQQLTDAIMAAHPEVTNWFIVGLVDDWSIGAERAVIAQSRQGTALVVSNQSDAFISELNAGGKGDVYVAACAISTAEITSYMAANLVAICDGRATPETIWPEWVRQGDKYPCVDVKGTMITKDTYKQWQKDTSFEALSAGMKTA